MAEENIDVYNKINEYEGLESLFIESLTKCEYKSDVVIVYAHYLLTHELDYECTKDNIKCDENKEQNVYKTVESLPWDWKKLHRSYNLIYKTGNETRILTAQKNSRELVVYFSKHGFDQKKISSNIILNNYIPDEFLRSNDISLIDNLSELRDILLKCFTKEDKIKAKRDHDKNLVHNTIFDSNLIRKRYPRTTADSNDPCNPLRNIRGSVSPAFHYRDQNNTDSEKLSLQNKHKHRPIDKNSTNADFLNDPNLFMVEYPVGPPDESYLT